MPPTQVAHISAVIAPITSSPIPESADWSVRTVFPDAAVELFKRYSL